MPPGAGQQPERNRAVLWVLLDSGLWISELGSLRVADVEGDTGEITVSGKGGSVVGSTWGGTHAGRCVGIWRRSDATRNRKSHSSWRKGGTRTGEAVTRSGFTQLIRKLGRAAGVQGVRCSPHTFRHTFAIEFLRGCGNVYELQVLMGHQSLEILRRYVLITQSDAQAAHRRASPGDRMNLR